MIRGPELSGQPQTPTLWPPGRPERPEILFNHQWWWLNQSCLNSETLIKKKKRKQPLKGFWVGAPPASVHRACDSWSWVCKFKPYVGYRDDLKKISKVLMGWWTHHCSGSVAVPERTQKLCENPHPNPQQIMAPNICSGCWGTDGQKSLISKNKLPLLSLGTKLSM